MSKLAAGVMALALALVACGSDDDDPAIDAGAPDQGTAEDGATRPDGALPIDGGPRPDGAPVVPGDGGGSSAVPAYLDPPWSEPAPPEETEVSAAASEVRSEAATRLGPGDLAMVEAQAERMDPRVAAIAQASDLRLDAAAWLLAESYRVRPNASALTSMAGLEAMRGGASASRAEVLARAAIDRIGDTEMLDVREQRVAASAWGNLGHARLERGETAGAVYAYRQALAHFDADPMYITGLAASLAAAGLPVPALQHALRARALEIVVDPALRSDAQRTPARDWVTHLQSVVQAGVAPPIALGRGGGEPLPAFPAVGSQLFGMTVLSDEASGELTMSAPPFEPHGGMHYGGSGIVCIEDGTDKDFECSNVPEGLAAWALVTPGLFVNVPEGTTCENAIDVALGPEPMPMRIMRVGPPGIASAYGGVGFALYQEFTRLVALPFGMSFGGSNALLTQVETCSDFSTRSGSIRAALERIDDGCPDCDSACTSDPDCVACFDEYRDACDSMFADAARTLGNEELRARADDVLFQANIARSIAISIGLEALLNEAGHIPCDEETNCPVELDPTDYRLAYAEHIGGRPAALLADMRVRPVIAYLECVSDIPPACPASSGGGARGMPGEVPCICLGVGPVGYCLQADGTFEITVGEGFMVGVRGNIEAGASSIRIGAGAGISGGVGFVRGGASMMAWYDPTRGRFTGVEVDVGVSIDVPGGGNVGTTVECDAWEDDAPNRDADPDAFALEATPSSPDE